MGEVMKLGFSITGEFVTDIARQWFWDEDKPYEVCEELLMACLVSDQVTEDFKKKAVSDILEGRKRLVGVNTTQLVDDNENIRPLSEKYKQMYRKRGIADIKSDMEINAINYVDPWSTFKSIKSMKDFQSDKCHSYDDCLDYFAGKSYGHYGDLESRYYEYKTRMGMWMFQYPELVYDATDNGRLKVGSDEFWANIYENIKDWDDPSFRDRNERYLASVRMGEVKKERSLSDLVKEGKEFLDNVLKKEEDNIPAILALRDLEGTDEDDIMSSLLVPDDILCWEGLISPEGDFYSCKFGAHNLKAYKIICTNFDKFSGIPDDIYYDNALDTLAYNGWCATRYLGGIGHYVTFPPMESGRKPTKAQINRIYDAMIKFDIKVNDRYDPYGIFSYEE